MSEDAERSLPGGALRAKTIAAVQRATTCIFASESDRGCWDAPCEFDPSVTAFYLLFTRYMRQVDEKLEEDMVRYLRSRQEPCGGWAAYPGGSPVLNNTVLCYAAMRAAGVPVDDLALVRARTVIAELGGVSATTSEARVLLAMLGQIPSRAIPYISPRLFAAPRRLAAAWRRWGICTLALLPAAVLTSRAAVRRLPEERSLAELSVHSLSWGMRPARTRKASIWSTRPVSWAILELCSRVLRRLDRSFPNRVADESVFQAIAALQGPDGSFGELLPATALNLMALDNAEHPLLQERVARGLKTLRNWIVCDHIGARQQFSPSTTHTTAYALRALLAAGAPHDECIARAVGWLEAHQACLRSGVARPLPQEAELSGWCFGEHSETSVDIDVTVIVLETLSRAGRFNTRAFQRGLECALARQEKRGGWAAYVLGGRPSRWLSPDVFFPIVADLLRPAVDITARVLLVLGPLIGSEFDTDGRIALAVRRGADFLWRHRQRDGSWSGRWVVNFAPCTGQVLQALCRCGMDPAEPRLSQSIRWLKSVQNADGGWGESKHSYATGQFQPAPSNAPTTSLVLDGLLAAVGKKDPAVLRGIEYLVATQEDNGLWQDARWNGVLVPGLSYVRYHLVPACLVVSTLSDWLHGGGPSSKRD